MQAFGAVQVIVNGHTDKTSFAGVSDPAENLRLNMQLSKDRARTVTEEFIRLGVPRHRMVSNGYGPQRPLVDADTPEAYAQNRRVEIEVR